MENNNLNRRDFLKKCGLAVGGATVASSALLAACSGKTETITKTETVTTTINGGGSGSSVADNDYRHMTVSQIVDQMKKEPAYGQTIYYEYDTGNCTCGPLYAALLGLYDPYGLKIEGLKGNEIKAALGTNKVQFGVHHIANLLVPITNGTPMIFTTPAMTGCKSLYVLNDSKYEKFEDLKGETISPPEGIGTADYNILCRMFIKKGIDPLKDVKYQVVETSGCVQAMKDGKIAGAILTDYYAYKFVKDGTLRCIRSITWDEDFADEPCCILAFNSEWAAKNPAHTYAITYAVHEAHMWIRRNIDEATQMLIDNHCTSNDDFAMNRELLWSLDWSISDEECEYALRNIITDYIQYNIITRYTASQVDEVLKLAWNPVLTK